MQLNPYLTFDGRCEEAFKFYEALLGGTIKSMMTYDSAPGENPPEWGKKIVSAMRLPLLRFRPPFSGLAREPRVRFSSSTAEAPPVDGFWSGRRRRARGHL